jgi:thiol:disulfide interchange protein DsbA
MRTIRLLLSAFACLLLAVAAHAQTPAGNENFGLINPPQATITGKKVEVIEFFAYYCPHCNALDASLNDWVKAQGDNIVFKRVHTTISGEAVPQQRLFYTLEAMGKEDEYHSKIFNAIHVEKQHLDSDEDIIAFMVKQGVDKQQFTDIYNSFSVQSKVQNALRMQIGYGVRSWPTIVFDGRFFTSPPLAGAKMQPYQENIAQNLMLKAMDQMVANLHQARAQ